MITFDTEFKVLEKEERSIPRRDGNGTFDFTEIKIETTDKKPTVLVARLANNDFDIDVGEIYNMRIGVSSTLTTTGKVFYNFVVLAFQVIGTKQEKPITPLELDDDEIPF